ncbi:MAG TPA: MFS transporter [Bryobacteraceae bacterium]|nr:MFS transporter [Bryobacteraceae bacterium]
MSLKEFRRAGHAPTLASAFLYFDISFMVWVILGPLGPFLGESLHLSASQKGFLTAVPLLGGSIFRILLGWMTERIGGKRTGLIGLSLTLVPLFAAWRYAESFGQFLTVGLLLGIAGASFAAALPLASGWYPPEYQGLAMGIAGAGNTGTLLSTLFAPRLATAFGWHAVFGFAMIPVILVWLFFVFMAKDAPVRRPTRNWSDYAAIFRERDTAWFCFVYSITFGGFSGLASYLSIFYHDQYGLTKVQAGDLTTLVVVFGSFLRPAGGALADRIGGVRMLQVLLAGIACGVAGLGALPPLAAAVALLILIMAMLGMGNGAVFQLVPQRFPAQVGMLTGVVGAAGGLGGFLLPSLLGTIKDDTGSFGPGFMVLAAVAAGGLVSLLAMRSSWRRTWPRESALRAGLVPLEGEAVAVSES